MSDDTLKIKRKLSALMSSLDDIEAGLSTLLSQSLPEVILGLDTIQQAKLQVVIPYLVYDLVFGSSQTHTPLHTRLPPTDTVYSLSKDKRCGPKNASIDHGARAFFPLVSLAIRK
jgi:hypothetical protein